MADLDIHPSPGGIPLYDDVEHLEPILKKKEGSSSWQDSPATETWLVHQKKYYDLQLRRNEINKRLAQLERYQRDRELEEGRVGLFYKKKFEDRLATLKREKRERQALKNNLLSNISNTLRRWNTETGVLSATSVALEEEKQRYDVVVRSLGRPYVDAQAKRQMDRINKYERAIEDITERRREIEESRRREDQVRSVLEKRKAEYQTTRNQANEEYYQMSFARSTPAATPNVARTRTHFDDHTTTPAVKGTPSGRREESPSNRTYHHESTVSRYISPEKSYDRASPRRSDEKSQQADEYHRSRVVEEESSGWANDGYHREAEEETKNGRGGGEEESTGRARHHNLHVETKSLSHEIEDTPQEPAPLSERKNRSNNLHADGEDASAPARQHSTASSRGQPPLLRAITPEPVSPKNFIMGGKAYDAPDSIPEPKSPVQEEIQRLSPLPVSPKNFIWDGGDAKPKTEEEKKAEAKAERPVTPRNMKDLQDPIELVRAVATPPDVVKQDEDAPVVTRERSGAVERTSSRRAPETPIDIIKSIAGKNYLDSDDEEDTPLAHASLSAPQRVSDGEDEFDF